MKKNLFVAAAMMVAMTACVKEADVNVNVEENTPQTEEKVWVEFTAGAETKAALNGTTVTWEKSDKISIEGEVFSIPDEDGAISDDKCTARFRAQVDPVFLEKNSFTAVYPAEAVTGGNIVVPAEQDGTANVVAVATVSGLDQNLQFRHLTSFFKFQVPAAATEVTISATEPLAGTVKGVEFDEATPSINYTVVSGNNTITLTGNFVTGKDYYAAVLPGSKSNLTVHIGDYFSKTWNDAVNVKYAFIANMGVLPELLFLVPNTPWKTGSTKYAAYFFNSTTDFKWFDVVDTNNDDVYEVEKQSDYSNVIFVRMKSEATENNWDNKEYKTGDMIIGNEPYCIIPFDVKTGSVIWSATSTYTSTGKYYLVPNDNWKSSNAWFATYFFNNSTGKNQWVKMTQFSTDPTYYEVEIPSGTWPNLIFCRMNSGKSTMNWNDGSVWNQTSDLAKQTSNNFYTVAAGAWSKGAGSWSKK